MPKPSPASFKMIIYINACQLIDVMLTDIHSLSISLKVARKHIPSVGHGFGFFRGDFKLYSIFHLSVVCV